MSQRTFAFGDCRSGRPSLISALDSMNRMARRHPQLGTTMKSNSMFSKLPVAVWVVALMSLKIAQAATVFPIATNNADTGFGIASDGTNYLVGIQGDRVPTNGYQVTAQMFGPTGALIGSRISPVPGHTGGNPIVACSGTNYLMVWPDDYDLSGNQSSNGQYQCISGQLISLSGAFIGSPFAITTTHEQQFSVVAYGAGKYLVTWNDWNGTNWGIYGQFVSSAGTLVGGHFVISPPVNGQDQKYGWSTFGGTNFLVVWLYTTTGTHYTTYGVFISPSGTVGTPFAISQTDSLEFNPAGAVYNGTNYLVVWDYEVPNLNIYEDRGRFVTQAGTFFGNEFAITTNQAKSYPALAFDGTYYLMSWNPNSDATNGNVQFQFLSASAQPIGRQLTPFSARGNQLPRAAEILFDGKRFASIAILTSDGFTPPAYGAGVYGTFIPAGTAPPQLGVAASFTGNQFSLSLTGTPGINYAVKTATNLVAPVWTSLATNSPTNGTFTFTDTSATNRSRFYRAVAQ
jgi:hypothetical protein